MSGTSCSTGSGRLPTWPGSWPTRRGTAGCSRTRPSSSTPRPALRARHSSDPPLRPPLRSNRGPAPLAPPASPAPSWGPSALPSFLLRKMRGVAAPESSVIMKRAWSRPAPRWIMSRPAGPCVDCPLKYSSIMVDAGSLSEDIPGTGIDVAAATVGELQRAITSGALTSAELTAFCLDRIERLNPRLRAVIRVSESATADAAASDTARAASGAPAGPLAGIPVLIKDNIGVRGMPATAGSPALQDAENGDAFVVGRLREAGAIVLGKANLSEWANFRSTRSSSGWSALGGQAVNPYGEGRNPSGSSSGSAVAVAAGLD